MDRVKKTLLLADTLISVICGLILILVILLLCSTSHGAEPQFTVSDRTSRLRPRLVVIDTTTTTPRPVDQTHGGTGDWANRPAPAGYQWVRWSGQPWTLEKVVGASGVAAPRPFLGIRTRAPRADVFSTQSTGSIETAPTVTGVPWTVPYGVTSGCEGGNCPLPSRRVR